LTISNTGNKNITANFEQLNAIYLDENGITVKAYDFAAVGSVYDLGVESYMVVDNDLLNLMIANGDDITQTLTTKVTDMSFMFFQTKTLLLLIKILEVGTLQMLVLCGIYLLKTKNLIKI